MSQKYKFVLQREKDFARNAQVCKSLRGVGMTIAQMGLGPFDPLGHHIFLPQINEALEYYRPKAIKEEEIKTNEDLINIFRMEGRERIHVCWNCGIIYESLRTIETK